MIRSSLQPILPNALRDAMLAALTARPAAALAGVLSVGLIKDPAFNPSAGTVLADCTAAEADFTGYAQNATAVYTAANTNSPGGRCLVATMDFIGAGGPPFVENTIWGYYVFSGAVLVEVEKWPGGLEAPIGAAGDFLSLTLEIPLDALQGA